MTYQHLELTIEKEIAWLFMKRAPGNELNVEFLQELVQAHRDLGQDEQVKAVILASHLPKCFCNGMDIAYIASHNLQERKELFLLFLRALKELYSFPKPHLSLIEGHAIAGGAFLALISDFRFMQDKQARYAFSEVAIALSIPKALLPLLRSVVAEQALRKVAMQAYFFRPKEALEIGLVDAVYPPEQAQKAALRHMQLLLRHPYESLCHIKAQLREATRQALDSFQEERVLLELEGFLQGPVFEKHLANILAAKQKDDTQALKAP